MSGELRNFDPNSVTVTFVLAGGLGSVDLSEGLVDEPNAISEAKDNPAWTRRGDRQGNMVRNKRPGKGGTLGLTYVAEAPIQDVLSGIYIQDQLLGNQVGDIVVKDDQGTTLMEYRGAFIEDDPALAFGDTAGNRTYTFGFAQRVPFFGGSEAVG